MPPRKSKVWIFFAKIEETDSVKCKVCSKRLKSSRNTTNMIQHLNLKHAKEFAKFSKEESLADTELAEQSNLSCLRSSLEPSNNNSSLNTEKELCPQSIPGPSSRSGDFAVPDLKITESQSSSGTKIKITPSSEHFTQPSVVKMFSNVQSYKTGGSKNAKLTQAIVEMIIIDNLPFSFVEGEGFIKLMKQQSPLYNVPTRNTIKTHIDKLYSIEVNKFKEALKDVPYICLTTDIWTDSQMNSMIGVTVHGLKEKSIFSGTIGVFKLSEAHTAVYIADTLEQVLAEFKINSDKIVAFVTDNGANMVKAISDRFGKHKHIPCFAHTLNLVCENTLDVPVVKELIGKCRNIVSWMKRHVNANDDLKKMQVSAGVSEGKTLKLLLDVRTRWNSTYYMLERLIKLLPCVSQIILNHVDAPPMISSKEKEDIIEIILLLRPLEAMTTQISGDKYATLSQIIPLVRCGREQLNKINCRYETSIKLKEKVISEFDRRFSQAEKSFLLAASTVLDPRFKKIHFTDPLATSTVLKRLRSEIAIAEETTESSSETSTSGDEEFDLWATHKNLVHKKRRKNNDATTQPQDELSFYLNAPVIGLKQNPVDAWDEMRTVYPKLHALSKKYCHLVGTSVPSERLFSKAGATATEKRNRLTTKRLSKLLFLNSWLKK